MIDPGLRFLERKSAGGYRFEDVGARTTPPLRVRVAVKKRRLSASRSRFSSCLDNTAIVYPLCKVLGSLTLGQSVYPEGFWSNFRSFRIPYSNRCRAFSFVSPKRAPISFHEKSWE